MMHLPGTEASIGLGAKGKSVLTLIVGAALLYVVYARWIYQPVIFGLRQDIREGVPFQKVPIGIPGIRASDCAECHREIYEEWKTSIHAQSYADPFFQAYWKKDRHLWVCLNCHAPLQNQQPARVVGLQGGRVERPVTVPNPGFDAAFQEEGITCAGCHVRDGVILGPYADVQAPHPTRYDPRYRSTEICYTCHQVPSAPFQFYNGGPCATFFEFEGGPYARSGYVCQTCHMPAVRRAVAKDGPVRADARRHLWRGGHDPDMVRHALSVRLERPLAEVALGMTSRFTLKLFNAGAGHKIPTGDPDRFFRVSFEVRDGAGRVLKSQEHIISRWIVWRPVILEVYENRIPPLEGRDYEFAYRVPRGADQLTLYARVTYHILTERAYRRLQWRYGLSVEVPHVFTVDAWRLPLVRDGKPVAEEPQREEVRDPAPVAPPQPEPVPVEPKASNIVEPKASNIMVFAGLYGDGPRGLHGFALRPAEGQTCGSGGGPWKRS